MRSVKVGASASKVSKYQRSSVRVQRFLQVLGDRLRTLLYLSSRLPDGVLQRWEGVVTGLQQELSRLQQRGLQKGANMQETLQVG